MFSRLAQEGFSEIGSFDNIQQLSEEWRRPSHGATAVCVSVSHLSAWTGRLLTPSTACRSLDVYDGQSPLFVNGLVFSSQRMSRVQNPQDLSLKWSLTIVSLHPVLLGGVGLAVLAPWRCNLTRCLHVKRQAGCAFASLSLYGLSNTSTSSRTCPSLHSS